MIIGITGKKKSGKDTFFKALSENNGNMVRYSFGDDLKAEVAVACGCTVEFIDENKDLFRPMLQWWGTDFRRNCFGKEYWVKKLAARIEAGESIPGLFFVPVQIPVITDVRFLNEAELVRERGGVVVRILGGQSVAGDTHASEVEMEEIKADYVIQNTEGLDELEEQAKDFLSRLDAYSPRSESHHCSLAIRN